jgi:hypothetical protein
LPHRWIKVDDPLACLYAPYTLLRLHLLQEEENYFTLAEDELDTRGSTTTSVGT